MNIIKIDKDDVVNGPGVRLVVWESFCPHHCKNCHNPETWEIYDEKAPSHQYSLLDLNFILEELSKPQYRGITFTGGDPLAPCNILETFQIIRAIKDKLPEKDIWIWTGYLYENLMENELFKENFSLIDVLIDGPFISTVREEDLKKDVSGDILYYRGSSNQRIIDIKETIKFGRIVEYQINKF